MSASERTNDLVVKLMAVAADVQGDAGKELMELLSKLAKTSQAERANGQRVAAQYKALQVEVEALKKAKASQEQPAPAATTTNIAAVSANQTPGAVKPPFADVFDRIANGAGAAQSGALLTTPGSNNLFQSTPNRFGSSTGGPNLFAGVTSGNGGFSGDGLGGFGSSTRPKAEQNTQAPNASPANTFGQGTSSQKRPADTTAGPESQPAKRPATAVSAGSGSRVSKPICKPCHLAKRACDQRSPCTPCRGFDANACKYLMCLNSNACNNPQCTRLHYDQKGVVKADSGHLVM